MLGRKSKKDDDFGPSKGLVRLFHKTVLFLLWPLRHPLISIPVLIIMFLAPTFMGVKPAEVHLWYLGKLKHTSEEVSEKVISTGKDLLGSKPAQPIGPSNIDLVTEKSMPDNQELHRKMFEKAQPAADGPVKIDILEQKRTPEVVEPIPAKPATVQDTRQAYIDSLEESNLDSPATKAPQSQSNLNNLGLVYLNTPKEIQGEAIIINANELFIGKDAIILYGIYVDPNTRNGLYAKEFLEEFIGYSPVKCIIEAYTREGVETGICYVRGESINHLLVKNGLSKDVALGQRLEQTQNIK